MSSLSLEKYTDDCWLTDEVMAEKVLPHSAQRQIYAYWRSRSPRGRLPGRQHIDPLEFPRLLPHIALIDVERAEGKARLRFRVFGTGLVEQAGEDLTGKWLHEVFDPRAFDAEARLYDEIILTGRPFLSRRHAPLRNRFHVIYDRLVLPLASDGVTVDKLLAYFVFADGM